jgi:hypothetical protein
MTKRSRRTRATTQLAKLIAAMATGGVAPAPATGSRGKGGLKDAKARARQLSTVDLLATLQKSREARRPLAKVRPGAVESARQPAAGRKRSRVS